MLAQTLFNVTDSFFAGLLSTEALTALGASFPIFFLIIAIMVGLGQAATALIANALGAQDEVRAKDLCGQATLLALVGGLAIAVAGFLVTAPLYRLMGLEGESLVLGEAYLLPILTAAPLFLLNATTNAPLVAQGDTRSNRNAMVVGALANCALNPLFMFGLGPVPGWGVSGIAAATILIQAAQLLYLRRRLAATAIGAGHALVPPPLKRDAMISLLAQALPITGQMLTTGVGLFAITFFMGRHGEAAVAAYGVALRIEQLAMLPMIGLTAATLTLVGRNNGAGRFDRVRAVAVFVLTVGVAMMLVGAVVVFPFRDALMRLFTDDPIVVSLGAAYLAVAVLNFAAYCILIVGASILQGLRRPLFPMIVGLFRHVFGPLAVLSLLDPVLGLGLEGIYWGIATIAWLGALAMLIYVRLRLVQLAG